MVRCLLGLSSVSAFQAESGDHSTTIPATLRLASVVAQLDRYSYRYSSEKKLHEALASILKASGIAFEHEYVLDAKNRADFWIDGIVLEVKVDGSMADALRQVTRYINLPQVEGVILAGTPRWASDPMQDKPEWDNKPFRMTRLVRQSL